MVSGTIAGRQQNVILNLIGVDAHNLEPDDRTCSICKETLQPALSFHSSREPEPPVKLARCGHIFGVRCIYRWLMHEGTCPMCRREILSLVLSSQRSTNTSAGEPPFQVPEWIDRSYTGGPIDNLAGNASDWGDNLRPVDRTPYPPAPTRRETQPVGRTPAWQGNEPSVRNRIPGRPIRRPVLRRLPPPSHRPAATGNPISRDRPRTAANGASDQAPRWTRDWIRRHRPNFLPREVLDNLPSWGFNRRPDFQTPALRRPHPWAHLQPITQGRALQGTANRRPRARTPSWVDGSITRHQTNNAVAEASARTPRWTPESVGRGRTDFSVGEASSAIAQLSIEDDHGQEGDVEASATTGTLAPSA